jgi:hypothetical protein
MKVPAFITNEEKAKDDKKRQLVSLSDIDVERDVLNLTYVSSNVNDEKRTEYFYTLKNWTIFGIELQVNFSNPLQVSNGINKDKMVIQIVNSILFTSASSGTEIPQDRLLYTATIPTQLPKGSSVENIEKLG